MNQQVAAQAQDCDLWKSIDGLHQIYRDALKQATTDCEELHIYDRYVRELSDLLRNCIRYCQRNMEEMKGAYEQQIRDLTSELKRYQQSGDESGGADLLTPADRACLVEIMNKLKSTVGDNTNKKFDVPNDLRHESKTIDLQSTCCSLEEAMSEMEKLRAENEALKNELKDFQAKKGEVSAKHRKMMETEIESLKSVRDELQMMHVASSNASVEASVQGEDVSRKGSGDYSEGSVGAPKGCREQLDYYCRQQKKIEKLRKKCLGADKQHDMSDTSALILEIADKHDHIKSLRVKNRKLEERLEQLEQKVKFREKIIRELRRSTRCQAQNISPLSLTPPRTPELKASDSCSNSDFDMYRSNFLTVPGQHIAKGDSCYSLYDLDQESNMGKSSSEVNLTLCFDDVGKDEIERLHHMINEMESENGCNRLLITRLEDELLILRKSESRAKQDRDLKSDKLRVLRHKVKSVGSKVLETSSEAIEKPKLHHNDLAVLEDDLKAECDVLNNFAKIASTTKKNLEKMSDENRNLSAAMKSLKLDLTESLQRNQQLQTRISTMELHESVEQSTQMPDVVYVSDKSLSGNVHFLTEAEHRKACANIARILSDTLGKEIQSETISELTSSSPESGESSLSNGHSLSDVISDWKRELEEKNCMLRDKIALIHSLEDQLRHKDSEICDVHERCQSVELDRDKSCQMVNQLKNAIQIHNESIQFLKRQNTDLRDELDEGKLKIEQHREHYSEMKKRNLELEIENNNLHLTITNLRSSIEDLKRGNSIQHSNDIDALNVSITLLNEQFFAENIQKDGQLNLLRDANLQLRSQVFDLNQDILDLLEIVESQKNRRMLEDFKITQKQQERQIEREISNRERDINCLKNFRSRCADIESEYLDKMASQKHKSDSTIKELETEITALTEQLIQSHTQTTDYDELMKQTAVLQNSMQDLESQNDILRKTIESYEGRFSELQVQLEKIHFENGSLISEIDNLKSDISDKNKRISELTLDQHKLEAEYENQKKTCNCSPKSSPEKRSSSSVIQVNDLKTKLMNKSLEQTKSSEALKRKTQQYEKLQKTAFDEKNRLREECLKSIQTIGELKSKISLLELRIHEQSDEVVTSREKINHTLAKMTSMESELSSKSAKLEDLETREEKWRLHAYEITHEIKNRKEDAFKREQKLIQELNTKSNSMKDQTRIILQHENSIHHLKSENDTLRSANASLSQRINELRNELEELKKKESGLCDLLEKTEEELKVIKSSVFELFNTSTIPEIKNVHGQMKNEKDDLESRYEKLVSDYNKLIDENRTLYEIKNDTISAIEIFKSLQEESNEREKAYQNQIGKLQCDKRNLHKDRTRLTKQLLSKHRDMIILNSEIDKFRDADDYESKSTSQYSLQPFQPVMYPSAIAPILRATSNPDLATDPIAIEALSMTEKMQRTRQFWSHGIQVAASSLVNIPSHPPQSQAPEEPLEAGPS